MNSIIKLSIAVIILISLIKHSTSSDTIEHYNFPFQIHLSVTGKNQITVSWASSFQDDPPVVYYRQNDSEKYKIIQAKMSQYKFGDYTSPFLFKAVLPNLKSNTLYYYKCGTKINLSEERPFSTKLFAKDKPIKIALMGDQGTNMNSYKTIQNVGAQQPDLILHCGDLSYANGKQKIWDVFMQMIESTSAIIPLNTLPGNHEYENEKDSLFNILNRNSVKDGSLIAYTNRFAMPFNNYKTYYSMDVSFTHIIMLNICEYILGDRQQHDWLVEDLKKVNSLEDRPWIIISMHYTMFSSSLSHQNSKIIVQQLEPIFLKYNVDLVFYGHNHLYERTKLIGKLGVNDPNGIIYLTCGNGGAKIYPRMMFPQPDFIAYRSTEYGHVILDILSNKEIKLEMIGNDGKIYDKTTIIKK